MSQTLIISQWLPSLSSQGTFFSGSLEGVCLCFRGGSCFF